MIKVNVLLASTVGAAQIAPMIFPFSASSAVTFLTPSCSFIMKAPVVSDGNIITSRGAGTAIDFALELIAVLVGKERALSVAESIVYR